MHLKQLNLRSYRAFEKASLVLPANGPLLVAGANNSGKTALLSALDVVAGRVTPENVQRAGSSAEPLIEARFSLLESDRAALLQGVPSRDDLIEAGALEWIDLSFELVPAPNGQLQITEVRGAWPYDRPVLLAWNQLDERNRTYTLYQAALDASLTNPRNVGGSHAASASGTKYVADRSRLSTLTPIFAALDEWRRNFYHFYALRQGTTRSRQVNSTPMLDATGVNLAEVLLWFNTNDRTTWRAIQDIVGQMVPEIGTLTTPVVGTNVEVRFEDNFVPGFTHNLKDLGTGVEQLILSIVVGLTQPRPALVVIEEPETNLHPGAQRSLLALLEEWSEDRVFVVSTHSPAMLDWSVPERVRLVSRSQGQSSVQEAAADPISVLRTLGVRLSDVLSSDKILLLEGPSDRNVLEVWFPEWMRDPGLAIILTEGADSMRAVPRFEDWLSQADKLGRRVLYLRDRDEIPRDILQKIQDSKTGFVLGRRELENYLLDPVAIHAVLTSSEASFAASGTTVDDVATIVDEKADQLKATVIIGRVCRRLERIRLADSQLRKDMFREKADLPRLREVVEARLPTVESLRHTIDEWWSTEEASVNSNWEDGRLKLAPGADVLRDVFLHLVGRGYSKANDGPAIAAAMASGPQDVYEVLRAFFEGPHDDA